ELHVMKGDDKEDDRIRSLKFLPLEKKENTKNVDCGFNLCYGSKKGPIRGRFFFIFYSLDLCLEQVLLTLFIFKFLSQVYSLKFFFVCVVFAYSMLKKMYLYKNCFCNFLIYLNLRIVAALPNCVNSFWAAYIKEVQNKWKNDIQKKISSFYYFYPFL
ncbi:hypothetical protein RFI_28381, partial [Reticulomyxa filosa]